MGDDATHRPAPHPRPRRSITARVPTSPMRNPSTTSRRGALPPPPRSAASDSTAQPTTRAGALAIGAANAYLDLAPESEWLTEVGCPVPRADMRRPGAARPLWRWRVVDLDAFLETRLVRPGEANPQDRR